MRSRWLVAVKCARSPRAAAALPTRQAALPRFTSFLFTTIYSSRRSSCILSGLELDIMSGRLASFKGPSTPNASPARAKPQQQTRTPSTPSTPIESTYHRKLRSLLYDIRTVADNWDDIILVDGLKAAKSLVDTRTELEYARVCEAM